MTAAEAHVVAAAIAADPTVTPLHRERAKEVAALVLGVGISLDESRALVAAKLAEWSRRDAYEAAGIMDPCDGRTPAQVIGPVIWRRREGSDHGPGQTWQDYAELCRQDMEAAEEALEKVK